MSSWLADECRRALAEWDSVRSEMLGTAAYTTRAYVHYRRGRILVRPTTPEGYTRAMSLRVPFNREVNVTVEWMVHFLRNLPCFP